MEITYSRNAADARSLGIVRTRLQCSLKDKKSNSRKKIYEWENQGGQRSDVITMVLLVLTSNSAFQGTLLYFPFFCESNNIKFALPSETHGNGSDQTQHA